MKQLCNCGLRWAWTKCIPGGTVICHGHYFIGEPLGPRNGFRATGAYLQPGLAMPHWGTVCIEQNIEGAPFVVTWVAGDSRTFIFQKWCGTLKGAMRTARKLQRKAWTAPQFVIDSLEGGAK